MSARGFLATSVAAAVVGAFAVGAPADEPAPSPPAAHDVSQVPAQRAANEEAYRAHVVPIRETLVHEHLGRWISIARGRVFPQNEHGTLVSPAATMEEAEEAARAAAPDARHRFVFRVGEEGDHRQAGGGAELEHVLGVGFLARLERPDVAMRGLGPRQPIHFVKDGVRTEITVKGPDDRMYVRPEVGPPGAAGRPDALYVISTGYSGYATLSAPTAARASLHLWEIPGKVTIEGAFGTADFRRARARFRFPGTDLDFTIPVAVRKD
jgi:hypothetical protein